MQVRFRRKNTKFQFRTRAIPLASLSTRDALKLLCNLYLHLQHLKWFVGKICFHIESSINIKTNTRRVESVAKYLLCRSYESPFNSQNPPQMGIRQLLPLVPLWRLLQVIPSPSLPFPGGSPLSHRRRRSISEAPSWLLGVFGWPPY